MKVNFFAAGMIGSSEAAGTFNAQPATFNVQVQAKPRREGESLSGTQEIRNRIQISVCSASLRETDRN
jgi:hypothetical protein